MTKTDNIKQLVNDEIRELELEQFELIKQHQEDSIRYHHIVERIINLYIEID